MRCRRGAASRAPCRAGRWPQPRNRSSGRRRRTRRSRSSTSVVHSRQQQPSPLHCWGSPKPRVVRARPARKEWGWGLGEGLCLRAIARQLPRPAPPVCHPPPGPTRQRLRMPAIHTWWCCAGCGRQASGSSSTTSYPHSTQPGRCGGLRTSDLSHFFRTPCRVVLRVPFCPEMPVLVQHC